MMKPRTLLLACLLVWAGPLLSAQTATGRLGTVAPNPYGTRPVITPPPASVNGVAGPVRSIRDGWLTLDNPEPDFFLGGTDARYRPQQAPGAGLPRRASSGRVGLKRVVEIPAEFAGSRIILQFHNTTQSAHLWVNGQFVRDYWGAFATWDADITPFVTPGQPATVALLLERSDGLGSFVRFTGSLTGEVNLFAVPEQHIERLRFETFFDEHYRDATLRVHLRLSRPGKGSVRLQFTDAAGKRLRISPAVIPLPEDREEFTYDLTVRR